MSTSKAPRRKHRFRRNNIRLGRRIARRAWVLLDAYHSGMAARIGRDHGALLACAFGNYGSAESGSRSHYGLRLRLWHRFHDKSAGKARRRFKRYKGQPYAMMGAYRSPFAWKRVGDYRRR